MSKREVLKLNRDNFAAWKSLMKLHLGSIGDYTKSSIIVEHINLVGPLSTDDMNKRKEQNQEMLEIASTLSYAKFDDIKRCDIACKMWKAL